ncbi:MAG: hypothetical protein EBU49_08070 [Proteobacteria bacterium]|nr:hypothetical protein [Pseudomonadota bacterium]
MIGRFGGSALMQKISGAKSLCAAAVAATLLVATATLTSGHTAGLALLAVGLCNSIMFPTIFALGVSGLGALTSIGSSLLVMAIVGGAIVPVLVGFVADASGLKAALALPALCYVYIAWFAMKCGGLESTTPAITSGQPKGHESHAKVFVHH